jgi:hypothetical protein
LPAGGLLRRHRVGAAILSLLTLCLSGDPALGTLSRCLVTLLLGALGKDTMLRSAAVQTSFPAVQDSFPFVGDSVALIRRGVSGVGFGVTFVGDVVSAVGDKITLVGRPPALVSREIIDHANRAPDRF